MNFTSNTKEILTLLSDNKKRSLTPNQVVKHTGKHITTITRALKTLELNGYCKRKLVKAVTRPRKAYKITKLGLDKTYDLAERELKESIHNKDLREALTKEIKRLQKERKINGKQMASLISDKLPMNKDVSQAYLVDILSGRKKLITPMCILLMDVCNLRFNLKPLRRRVVPKGEFFEDV